MKADSLSNILPDLAPDFSDLKQNAQRRREERLSKANVLLRYIDPIEDALAAGVRHKDILEMLNRAGFALTEETYTNLVYRARKTVKERLSNTGA